MKDEVLKKLHLLSGLTREMSERGQRLHISSWQRDDIDELLSGRVPTTVQEKEDRFLHYMYDKSPYIGAAVNLSAENDYPLVYARAPAEFVQLLLHLERQQLIEWRGDNGGRCYLTPEGGQYVEDKLRSTPQPATSAHPVLGTLEEMLAAQEGSLVERKASLRWDFKQDKKNQDLERAVAKAVAGFLNVRQGGHLLIGIGDDGSCLGLDRDYSTFKSRQNWDGFEQHLVNTLGKYLGSSCLTSVHPRREMRDAKDICVVNIELGHGPTFLTDSGQKQHFYVRTGNTTRELVGKELIEYTREMWSGK